MVTGWRAMVAATAVAVVTTTGAAAALASPSAPRGPLVVAATRAAVTRPSVSPRSAELPALPPVTQHALDPELVDAAQAPSAPAGGQAVTEVIQLTIIGGELELVTETTTVTLQRVLGSDRLWTGTLPAVRVIDARGTHEGWKVRWTVAGLDVQGTGNVARVPEAALHLRPGGPVVVDGTPDGLMAGKAGPAVRKGRTLFGATPGAGGGTYEAGGMISLRLPSSVDADSVVVELAFGLV